MYIGSISSPMLQSIIDMRKRLDLLQQQFGTGLKSTNYAGLGIDRGISLSLRSQLAGSTSFDQTIQTVGVRLSVAQTALTGFDGLVRTVKTAAQEPVFSIDQTGQSSQQKTALTSLREMLSLLNTRAGDHYLFSGQAVDRPAVVSADLILNGDVTHAGLIQMIDERKQADLGAGLGRLTITPAGTTITLEEDGVHPFGFKITAAASTLSNTTLTGPTGSPASMDVDFTGLPAEGEAITISLTLPDGSAREVTLKATAASPAAEGQFAIGATAADTASNFEAALTASLSKLVATELPAASAMAASDNFFGNPPQRVDGPPFDSATALIDGTSTNTVIWYVGEDGPTPPRSTATARIDPTMTVNYGMRANEQALRTAIQSVATFAAVTSSTSDPDAQAKYKALASRVSTALAGAQGQQKIADIEAEIAATQIAFASAKERHAQTSNMLADLLQKIESVPQEEVGVQILSLQTSLQASLQTTAMLSKISLINYLPV